MAPVTAVAEAAAGGAAKEFKTESAAARLLGAGKLIALEARESSC